MPSDDDARGGRASGLRGVTCVVAAVAFALSLTASVARAADSGIEIGARTGYALSAGNRGTTADGMNAPVANYVQGFFPLWLDVGYRFDPALYLGGFFSYGFGIVNDASQTTCREANNSCSASDTRLGLMGRYTFPLTGALAPWLGLGVGYEWGSFSWSGQSPLLSGTINTTWSGYEFANLQAGGDIPVTQRLVLAPFLSVSIGQFRNVTTKTTAVTPLGTTTMITDEDLVDTSIHEWILFGVRAAFRP